MWGAKIIEFVLTRTSFLSCRRQRCRLMMRCGRFRMWNVLKIRCPRHGRNGTGLLRKKCRIPIALHSSDTKLILDHVRQDGIDYVNVGGTIGSAVRAAAVSEAAGCLVWLQFEGHGLDIQAAFDAHVGAAIPNASLPYDSAPFLREGSITKEGYSHSVKDGHFEVPQKPGLGVTLDLEACEKYQVA